MEVRTSQDEKYVKCFRNREAFGNGCAFEQVAWYAKLSDAKKDFELDKPFANEHKIDQYIFKLVKIKEPGKVEEG